MQIQVTSQRLTACLTLLDDMYTDPDITEDNVDILNEMGMQGDVLKGALEAVTGVSEDEIREVCASIHEWCGVVENGIKEYQNAH